MAKPAANTAGPWKKGFFNVSQSVKFQQTAASKEPFYRSSYEWLFMKWCETTTEIARWGSEPFSIKYRDLTSDTDKLRNYWIDFTVATTSKEKWWVEVKPSKQVESVNVFKKRYEACTTKAQRLQLARQFPGDAMNYSKWMAARFAAEKQGALFKIVTEKTLKRI